MMYLESWKISNGYPTTMSDEECDWWEDIKYERKKYERIFTKHFFRKLFPELFPKPNTFAYADKNEVREKVDVLHLLETCGIPHRLIRGNAQFLCQFHSDTKPSASFNVEKKYFVCFACGERGDIFTFYSKLNGIGFAQAVEELNVL